MAKCPICKKNLVFSMSENTWKCPSGCNLQGKKIQEEQKPANLPQKTQKSKAVMNSATGYRLSVASIIYFIIGAIINLVFAIMCFVAEDAISGYAYLGSILDLALFSAIAYVVGDIFSRVNSNFCETKQNSINEIKNTELLNKCIEKIDMQSKCILELTKEIEALKKEINK